MNDSIEKFWNTIKTVCEATDQALNEWKGEGNLQFPQLLGMIAVKHNWTDKQVRDNDPIIRSYVRQHPDWYVTRGAHGGIMRKTDKQTKDAVKQAKEADKAARELAKQQMREAIEAKTAAQNAASNSDSE